LKKIIKKKKNPPIIKKKMSTPLEQLIALLKSVSQGKPIQFLNEDFLHSTLRQKGRAPDVLASLIFATTDTSDPTEVLTLAQQVAEDEKYYETFDESTGVCSVVTPAVILTTLTEFKALGFVASADVDAAIVTEVATTIGPSAFSTLVIPGNTGKLVTPFTSSVDGQSYLLLSFAGEPVPGTNTLKGLVHFLLPNPAAPFVPCPTNPPTPTPDPCVNPPDCDEDDECEEDDLSPCSLHNFKPLSH
jgi:hypothetical protein